MRGPLCLSWLHAPSLFFQLSPSPSSSSPRYPGLSANMLKHGKHELLPVVLPGHPVPEESPASQSSLSCLESSDTCGCQQRERPFPGIPVSLYYVSENLRVHSTSDARRVGFRNKILATSTQPLLYRDRYFFNFSIRSALTSSMSRLPSICNNLFCAR